jgi:hypothetical protein
VADEYTPGKAHEELVELIWANVPAWDYPTDVDRLAEAIDRYWLTAHDREVAAKAVTDFAALVLPTDLYRKAQEHANTIREGGKG